MSATGAARSVHGAPVVWNVRADAHDKSDETRFPDFVAFLTFGFPVVVLPVAHLPVNEVAPLALCVLVMTREITSRARTPFWFVGGLVLVLGMLSATSYLHGLLPAKRLLHVVLYITLAAFIASGRIHLPSAARGLAYGLLGGILLSIAGFGPDNYTGRLTGFLGDPNGGGYVITVLGLVAIGLRPRGRIRYLLMVVVLVAVVLTYSRTTLLAVTFAVVWILVGRRLNLFFGSFLVVGMIYIVGHIPPQLRLFGPFADRQGSDALRTRIIAQEKIDIAHSPIIGNGAGTAKVNLAGDEFFYHSSYLALQAEGGLIAVVLLVGTITLTFLSITRMPKSLRNGWIEASLIALMVCAVNVGEVLLELPAAIALGVAMWHRLNAVPHDAQAPPPPIDTRPVRPARPAPIPRRTEPRATRVNLVVQPTPDSSRQARHRR